MARMPLTVRLPLPTVSHLPFKEPCSNMLQAFMLPHELFAAIWNHYPATLKKCIVEGEETLRTFWRSNAGHRSFQHFLAWRTYPTMIHVAFPLRFMATMSPSRASNKSWAQGMTVFSWSSLVGVGGNSRQTISHLQLLGEVARSRKEPSPWYSRVLLYNSCLEFIMAASWNLARQGLARQEDTWIWHHSKYSKCFCFVWLCSLQRMFLAKYKIRKSDLQNFSTIPHILIGTWKVGFL